MHERPTLVINRADVNLSGVYFSGVRAFSTYFGNQTFLLGNYALPFFNPIDRPTFMKEKAMENAAVYEDGFTVELQLLNLSNDDCFTLFTLQGYKQLVSIGENIITE